MIVITVNFRFVEVSKYERNQPVQLKIFFDNGSEEKFIEKSTNLENIEEFTQDVINSARKIEKEANAGASGSFLDDVVMVRFGEDEEKTELKLSRVFSRIKEDIKNLRINDSPQSYLQRLAMIQNAKYNI